MLYTAERYKMKFNQLSGDVNWQQYGGKFVSKRLSNGDFNYWLVMDVVNMHDATEDESQDKYNVSILAVSPEQAEESGINSALSCCGIEDGNPSELLKVEALVDYGIFAMLWNESSNNITSLMKKAHKEAQLINGLFGFYMDKPENRIGQNGWELIAGQSIRDYFNK